MIKPVTNTRMPADMEEYDPAMEDDSEETTKEKEEKAPKSKEQAEEPQDNSEIKALWDSFSDEEKQAMYDCACGEMSDKSDKKEPAEEDLVD